MSLNMWAKPGLDVLTEPSSSPKTAVLVFGKSW